MTTAMPVSSTRGCVSAPLRRGGSVLPRSPTLAAAPLSCHCGSSRLTRLARLSLNCQLHHTIPHLKDLTMSLRGPVVLLLYGAV